MGQIRLGFLGSQGPPRPKTCKLICGVSKRKSEEPSAGTPPKKEKPTSGTRPVITMKLYDKQNIGHQIKALLDTGCSINLISQRTIDRLEIPRKEHEEKRMIESFTGTIGPGAGQYYTDPLRLQHRKHFSREVFEISPMEEGVDIFLPFSWIEQHPPQGAWSSDQEVRFNSARCLENCNKFATNEFSLTWDDTVATDPAAGLLGHVSTACDEDPLQTVPVEFCQYLGIMGKEAADRLPEHRPYDCKIDLKEGATAPWGPIYPLSEIELQTLREWLKEMEKTGKIKRSTSPAGSPILFVPKPNGRGLRLCVDYRGLSAVTIPNRYPLPLMQELQDRVQGAQWFTKMDLKNGFNLIRVREGDEWKTAFRTRYGLYEFQVMPFGPTNPPSTFQDMMNHVLSDGLDVGVLAYMDDILIYAKNRGRTRPTGQRSIEETTTKPTSSLPRKMRVESQGGRIPGLHNWSGWHQDVNRKSGNGPELENPKLIDRSPVLPRIRQLLPMIYQRLLQSSPTIDGINEKGNRKELVLE